MVRLRFAVGASGGEETVAAVGTGTGFSADYHGGQYKVSLLSLQYRAEPQCQVWVYAYSGKVETDAYHHAVALHPYLGECNRSYAVE